MTLTQAMLAGAAVRALRHWLFELGHENAAIRPATGGVYHLVDVGRLVQVKTAITPSHPPCLSTSELRALQGLAQSLNVRAWEAQIIVRPNFHPAAIIWRDVETIWRRGSVACFRKFAPRTALAAN